MQPWFFWMSGISKRDSALMKIRQFSAFKLFVHAGGLISVVDGSVTLFLHYCEVPELSD